MSEKAVVASNLTLVAALIQLINATKGKATTSNGISEAIALYREVLSRVEKKEV